MIILFKNHFRILKLFLFKDFMWDNVKIYYNNLKHFLIIVNLFIYRKQSSSHM